MEDEDIIRLFENHEIRTIDYVETNQTYYSVLDTIKVITDSENPKQYWQNIVEDGILFGTDLTENCKTFDVESSDGKFVKMEFATREHILRIISSIPSPKAEPYKEWLSKQGMDRINEISDPELIIQKAISDFENLGYSKYWISRKIRSII